MALVMKFDDDCVFCKILKGQEPCEKVYEDSFCFAFRDINPQAPTHILVVPRAHLTSLTEVDRENCDLLGHIFVAIAKIVKKEGIEEQGFRVVCYCGEGAGQTVEHLHFHILSGGDMKEKMN